MVNVIALAASIMFCFHCATTIIFWWRMFFPVLSFTTHFTIRYLKRARRFSTIVAHAVKWFNLFSWEAAFSNPLWWNASLIAQTTLCHRITSYSPPHKLSASKSQQTLEANFTSHIFDNLPTAESIGTIETKSSLIASINLLEALATRVNYRWKKDRDELKYIKAETSIDAIINRKKNTRDELK